MSENENIEAGAFKSGFVALVGRPNVGKSTLTNALLGEKVSIVTPKPQTTRNRIHGILNRDDAQVVLVDTPGFCGSETPLRRVLRKIAGQAPADSDVTLIVAEIKGREPSLAQVDRDIIQAAQASGRKVILAINKIDRLERKEMLLPWIEEFSKQSELAAIIPISATKGDGLDVLLDTVLSFLPEGPAMFPADMYTDQVERRMCEELIREQLLFQTHEEVPHNAAVVIETFEDGRPEGEICHLEGRIIVARDSQKGIVVGKKGARIKEISTKARLCIEELLGSKVFLRLSVVVDQQWTRHEQSILRYGIGLELEE